MSQAVKRSGPAGQPHGHEFSHRLASQDAFHSGPEHPSCLIFQEYSCSHMCLIPVLYTRYVLLLLYHTTSTTSEHSQMIPRFHTIYSTWYQVCQVCVCVLHIYVPWYETVLCTIRHPAQHTHGHPVYMCVFLTLNCCYLHPSTSSRADASSKRETSSVVTN